ncbi:MAG: hypothetical protein HFG03_10875 [Oscillibacter sp.]|nr:hypothetical protein [Oscillibacter sp.]
MSYTIDMNYLTSLAGNLSRTSAVRQPASQGGNFLSMAAQLRASESSPTPTPSEKTDMSMEAYRQSIREMLSQMPLSTTRQMESISIQISDAAFERMKNDPDYEAWVLNDLREAFSQSNPWVAATGGGYSVFYIGETKEQCHAEGWYPGYMGNQGAAMFEDKANGSFWERRMENHKKYMELQQEAAARRRMLMKLRMNGGSVSAAELLMGLL